MMDELRDLVTLVKTDGKKYGNIPADVQSEIMMIFIGGDKDKPLPVVEGDTLIRELPNGLTEEYIVTDRGYAPIQNIVFQCKVKRKTTLSADKKSSITIRDIKAEQVNIGDKGIQIQHKTGVEDATLQQFFAEIREFIEKLELLSDKAKSALVEEVKDLESGNLSKVEVAHKTENIIKQVPSLREKFEGFAIGVGSSLAATGILHGDKIIAGIKFALGLS